MPIKVFRLNDDGSKGEFLREEEHVDMKKALRAQTKACKTLPVKPKKHVDDWYDGFGSFKGWGEC